jgi:hypothetical protein
MEERTVKYRYGDVGDTFDAPLLGFVGTYEGPVRAVIADPEGKLVVVDQLERLTLIREPIVVPDLPPEVLNSPPGAINMISPASKNKKDKRR